MQSDVDKIKSRLSIVDVVSPYVDLKPAGNRLKGLSPFTAEKTPSFFVSPEQGFYHCFSTDQGGDIFNFIQTVEGLDFSGALKLLADKAGVELTGVQSDSNKGDKDKVYAALDAANEFFRGAYKQASVAQHFLVNRGVNEKSIDKFSIGYAPDDWRGLYDSLRKNFNDSALIDAGLIKQKNNSTYDLFRDRVMFPIKDIAGRIIAFSGRRLDGEKAAKYLNSPENPVFKKSNELYGLHEGRDTIRKLGFAILVEGQIDLVLSHQAGNSNTVASSGTAFTSNHLKIIKRYTDNLLLAFDPDSAGIKASIKVGELAYRENMNVKSVVLPEGKDPADIINEDPKKWHEIVKSSVSLPSYLVTKSLKISRNETHHLDTIRKVVIPLIAQIESPIIRQNEIETISDLSSISPEVLSNELDLYLGKNKSSKVAQITTVVKGVSSVGKLDSRQKIMQAISDKCTLIKLHFPKEAQPQNLPEDLPEPSTKAMLSQEKVNYRQLNDEVKLLLRDLNLLSQIQSYGELLRQLEGKQNKTVDDLNQIIEIKQKLEKLPESS